MTDKKAVIKNADMSEDMQQDAVDCATQAMEKYNIEKDIAAFIKKEFDKKYNPTWHCIVGRNFGSYVTHETKHFIYFYLGQVAILLFNLCNFGHPPHYHQQRKELCSCLDCDVPVAWTILGNTHSHIQNTNNTHANIGSVPSHLSRGLTHAFQT
uniref:Dynein light chain n=1 Tax=Myripristis murdjan TaxID=586833 RepID=A0A667XIM2_9TELE